MSSNWPSALVSSSSSRSLNSSPVETLNETNSSSLAMVQGEVKDLSSKVQELQNAYEEYLDAEQDVSNALHAQYAKVSDDRHMTRISEIMSQMAEYSKKMDAILKRMDNIYDRVEKLKMTAEETKEIVETVPPGKPIPSASKQIQDSMNSYVNRAKSTLENTVASARNGDMRDRLSDSMSIFGDRMSQMVDKAKSTVQNFRN